VELLQKICRATGKAKKIFSKSLMAGQGGRGAARMQWDEGNAANEKCQSTNDQGMTKEPKSQKIRWAESGGCLIELREDGARFIYEK
jgi:hypothetical protein